MDILLRFPGISKPYHHQDGLYIIPYEWTALRNIYAQLLGGFNVDVQLSSTLTSAVITNSFITELIANEKISIRPNAVVDCSGNAIVSQLAGLEIISDRSYQAASQIFRLKKVSQISEYGLNMALKKVALKQGFKKNWPLSHRSLAVVQGSIRKNSVDLKITLPEIISDNTDLEVLKKKAVSLIDDLFPVLKKEIKSLEQAEIRNHFSFARVPGDAKVERKIYSHGRRCFEL